MPNVSFNKHLGMGLLGTGLATAAATLLSPETAGRDLGGMAIVGTVISILFATAASRSQENALPQKPALRVAVSNRGPVRRRGLAPKPRLHLVR